MDLRVQCDEHLFFLTLPRDACISSLKRMLYDAIYRDYALEMIPAQQRITLGSVYPEELHDDLLLLCLLPTHRDHLVLHLPIFLTRPVPSTYVSDASFFVVHDSSLLY